MQNKDDIESLADLFKDYQENYVPEEWDTGAPVGNEIIDDDQSNIKNNKRKGKQKND